MHSLLKRQLKRFLGPVEEIPAGLMPLFEAIDESYRQADLDRAMIERSLDIASQEMLEQNCALAGELQARRAAESQVEHLSNFDMLTGLANRSLLNDRLSQAIASAQRQGKKVAVLALGLDDFKTINESLGHGVGNELLRIVGERLGHCLRGSDSAARLGGDEYALILSDFEFDEAKFRQQSRMSDIDINSNLIDIVQRISTCVSEAVMLAGREAQITCSMGISVFPQDGSEAEILLGNAGTAMSSAKQMGRNNFQFYTANLSAIVETRLAMQGELRLALERREFILHYQPQVDFCSGRIVGMEALIRWNHPELGLVPPVVFIGLAEQMGLIVPIGGWVIRSACEQGKAWQLAGHGKFRIAVNLSVRQFSQPDLVEYIASVLAETGLEAQYLEIELTESLVMNDVESSIEILNRLKQLGVHVSIDDFGTGYSSLAYLKRFPINVLKIDQSFVRDINGADDAAIVKAIISMAHSLGMRVIAEGVETEAQCGFLCLNMCDEFQGYLFCRPLAAQQIDQLLARKSRLPDRLLRRV